MGTPMITINCFKAISKKITAKEILGIYCAFVSTPPHTHTHSAASPRLLLGKLLCSDLPT